MVHYQSPFPIARRSRKLQKRDENRPQTFIISDGGCQSGSSPGSRSSRACAFPGETNRPSDVTMQVCSLIQWRDRTGFAPVSLLSPKMATLEKTSPSSPQKIHRKKSQTSAKETRCNFRLPTFFSAARHPIQSIFIFNYNTID